MMLRDQGRSVLGVLALMSALLADNASVDAQIFPFPNNTAAPTDPPVPVTAAPTVSPTPAPVVPATAAPTQSPVTASPTQAPVADPTLAPVTEAPTPAPVADPTEAPVAATADPTRKPTDPPVTDSPTPAPQPLPTTAAPTVSPTTAAPVTEAPTGVLPTTEAPTAKPTLAPTESPTASPTVSPTEVPTVTPTLAPTFMPTWTKWGPVEVQGLSMQLNGVGEMTTASQQVFEEEYEFQCTEFFEGETEEIMRAVDGYQTKITFDTYTSVSRRVLRRLGFQRFLQEPTTSSVLITYNQELEYRADHDEIPASRVIEAPFKTKSRRDAFRDRLVASGDPAYENMPAEGAVSQIYAPDETPAPSPPAAKSNTTTIIIAVCAAVGGLLILGGGYLLYKRRAASKSAGMGASSLNDEDGKPPSQLQLSTNGGGGNDDVSTLAEPTPKLGVQSGESLAGYGDQSVATVDYDYSKAYGGGGEASVVSSAGGTLGSQTRGGVTTQSGSGAAGLAAGGAAGASIFSDDNSFEQSYGANVSVKEEMIEVYAPPGKLGVVIDTPDEGAPVVHAIKDSSCIADQLKVGDKLIAVDDEDVRAMTAIKVSKMISRKSANPQRKLTVVRTTVSE